MAKQSSQSSLLILVRHGQSVWNLKNQFTGWRDVGLTDKGIEEARAAGRLLAGYGFDLAYTSALRRAQQTLDLILAEMAIDDMKIIVDQALNERDYGDLTGLNKDDARERWGGEQVHLWRRSYDVAPPGGESLKQTAKRSVAYYLANILPTLKGGQGVLVVAHGNSLRSLVMEIEGLDGEEIVNVEIATGVPIVYHIGDNGEALSKQVLQVPSTLTELG